VASETWELRITGYTGPEPNQSVQHFKGDNIAVSDTVNVGYDLINAWIANVKPKWLAMLPIDYYLDTLEARRVDPKLSAVAHHQYGFRSTPGTFGTHSQASQTNPCLTLIPPMGIKSAGKIFLPGCPKTFVVNSVFSAGAHTALNNWFNVVKVNFGLTTITWIQAIYSKKTNITSTVQLAQFSPVVGFQERRRVFFGRSTTKKKPKV